ncbi:hypothetical protein [Burkholderia sp. PU8-34]
MKVDIQTISAANPFGDALAFARPESANAFGQLLRSMEREMWNGASQAERDSREPGLPGSRPHHSSVQRMRPINDDALPAPANQPEFRACIDPSADSGRVRAAAETSHAPITGLHSRVPLGTSPASPATAIAMQPCERRSHQAPPPRLVFGESGAEPSACLADRSASYRQPTADAPFRLTVSDGESGIAIALRTRLASHEDLDALDLHARQALRRYGIRSATLLVNGVNRNLTISGEHSHGD